MLGLTSVYREGFETVLFLQSLELSAGTATVLEGAGLGLALTFAVGAVTFYFQRKLPYKKMLIVTGVFIGFVLVVMVGQTARTMQGTGWMPITPIDVSLPYWPGLWLGVYPTVETIGAQIAAAIFVIGSYFLAQEMKVKRPRRRAKARRRRRAEPPRARARRADADAQRASGGSARVGGPGRARARSAVVSSGRGDPRPRRSGPRRANRAARAPARPCGRRRSTSSTADGAGSGAGSPARCGGR